MSIHLIDFKFQININESQTSSSIRLAWFDSKLSLNCRRQFIMPRKPANTIMQSVVKFM